MDSSLFHFFLYTNNIPSNCEFFHNVEMQNGAMFHGFFTLSPNVKQLPTLLPLDISTCLISHELA